MCPHVARACVRVPVCLVRAACAVVYRAVLEAAVGLPVPAALQGSALYRAPHHTTPAYLALGAPTTYYPHACQADSISSSTTCIRVLHHPLSQRPPTHARPRLQMCRRA